jgi:hypothetical protein
MTRRTLALSLLSLAVCGCGEPATTPGAAVAALGVALDAHHVIGEPFRTGSLTVWPLYTDQVRDLGAFRTLDEAIAAGEAEVREVGGVPGTPVNMPVGTHRVEWLNLDDVTNGLEVPRPTQAEPPAPPAQGFQTADVGLTLSTGPQVNSLVIENRGDEPILVCAGTLVRGGQQDRQIGEDVVVAAGATVPVDAYCVEPGRWSARQAGSFLFGADCGVALHGVRANAQYAKDQGEVWTAVRATLAQVDVGTNPSETLLAAVDGASADRRASIEQAVRAHFAALAEGATAPVGFAYAVGDTIVTVRSFAHPRVLEGQLPAFVKAMAMETVLAGDAPAQAAGPVARDVVAFVRDIEKAEETLDETGAANVNGYRHAANGFAAKCYLLGVEGAERVVVSEDWTSRRP